MRFSIKGKLIVMILGTLLLSSGCVVSVEDTYHPCDECYADEECVYDHHYDEYICVQVNSYYLNSAETSPPATTDPVDQADESISNSPANEGGAHE